MIDCALCTEELKPSEGQLIWRGDDCRVILVNHPDLPGFCRVIWNRHAAEMTDLTNGEREHLMTLVFTVEEVVRRIMKADKVNIAALGNMVPHLHWHVIPRYGDDAFFPGSAWSERTQETPAPLITARKQKAEDLPAAVKAAITALS